jgi:hypothetical protein
MPIGATDRAARGEEAEEAEGAGVLVEVDPAEAGRFDAWPLEFILCTSAATAPGVPVAVVADALCREAGVPAAAARAARTWYVVRRVAPAVAPAVDPAAAVAGCITLQRMRPRSTRTR